jgi:hypothetical protein
VLHRARPQSLPITSRAFRQMLNDAGINVVRLPARSPNLNSHAERWIGCLRSECLSRIIPLGEWHLRCAIESFMEHSHSERNHQGLGNRLGGDPSARRGDPRPSQGRGSVPTRGGSNAWVEGSVERLVDVACGNGFRMFKKRQCRPSTDRGLMVLLSSIVRG